jgi:phosphatidylinositol phosphate synthase
MKSINDFLDACKTAVKRVMRAVARALNALTGGKLSPNAVTIVGLLAHVPIAWLIATGHPIWGAVLLVIFGLFDTLDGELARLQGTESPVGMLLDSVTDRMKEVILYIGIIFFLVGTMIFVEDAAYVAALVVAACGGSLLVSYVNAWGDAILSTRSKKHAPNQTFRSGLMRFEVRMFLIAFGLATGWLLPVISVIAVLAWWTAFDRLINVIRRLA